MSQAIKLCWGLGVLFVLTGAVHVATAQQVQGAIEQDRSSLMRHLERGIAAYEDRRWEDASQALRHVVAEEPLLRDTAGSAPAIYWLGRARLRMSRVEQACLLWRAGIQASQAAEDFGVHLADAYVRTVFQEGLTDRYDEAARIYQRLLLEGSVSHGSEERNLVNRHRAQLHPVLPDSLQSRLALYHNGESGQQQSVSKLIAQEVEQWWRSLNPRPSTPKNERVIEHLLRVSHAISAFPADTPAGFDDRGKVYVRYGAPVRKAKVDFYQRELRDRIHTLRRAAGNNLVVTPGVFKKNEFWIYQHHGSTYYFLFIKEGDAYKHGNVMDLIPRHLTTGADGSTGRGGAKIDVALEALHIVYRQLSMFHSDYATRYSDVANYIVKLDNARRQVESRQRSGYYSRTKRSDSSILVQESDISETVSALPGRFLRSMITQSNNEDRRNVNRRDSRIPRQKSRIPNEPIPVSLRLARFLDTDGTTRVEAYWGIQTGTVPELLSSNESTIIDVFVQHIDEEHNSLGQEARQYKLPASTHNQVLIPRRPVTTRGVKESARLLIEWSQYQDQVPIAVGKPVRTQTLRTELLHPLGREKERIEMSDLVPVLIEDVENVLVLPDRPRSIGLPYPLESVSPEVPTAIYFEIYGLSFNAEDQTRYTLEYEVEHVVHRGGITAWLRGDRVRKTSTAVTHEGETEKAEEYIVIDLQEGAPRGSEKVTITVRVTDEVRGDTRERSLTLNLEDPR